MTTLGLDQYGDLDLQGGRLTKLTGAYECAQKIYTRLSLFLGEWFLDQREGIPIFTLVLVKNPDIDAIRRMYEKIIRETPGVRQLLSLTTNYDPAGRTIGLSFVAQYDNGAIITGGRGQPYIVDESGAS